MRDCKGSRELVVPSMVIGGGQVRCPECAATFFWDEVQNTGRLPEHAHKCVDLRDYKVQLEIVAATVHFMKSRLLCIVTVSSLDKPLGAEGQVG